jgi:hypothetical protein
MRMADGLRAMSVSGPLCVGVCAKAMPLNARSSQVNRLPQPKPPYRHLSPISITRQAAQPAPQSSARISQLNLSFGG